MPPLHFRLSLTLSRLRVSFHAVLARRIATEASALDGQADRCGPNHRVRCHPRCAIVCLRCADRAVDSDAKVDREQREQVQRLRAPASMAEARKVSTLLPSMDKLRPLPKCSACGRERAGGPWQTPTPTCHVCVSLSLSLSLSLS